MQKRLNQLILFIVSFACFQTVESQTLPDYLPSNGLVAWYPFNGNANDESGNGNDFVNPNFSFSTNADLDSAANLFGTNFEYAPIAEFSGSQLNQPFSFSFSYLGNSCALILGTGSESFNIYITSVSISFSQYGSHLDTWSTSTSYTSDLWNKVLVTRNNIGEFFFYVNSIKYGPFYWQNNMHPCEISFNCVHTDGCGTNIIACTNFQSSDFYVDDISMFNRVLERNEVQAIQTKTPVSQIVDMTQSPPGIPYQAVVRNASGQVAANTSVATRFTLHQNTTDGAVEYQETHALTTNAQGLVSAVIGQGSAVQGTFAGINWANTTKFMQVEMDLGSGYVDMGTQQLMSVPYALYSNGISVNVSSTGDTLSIGGNHVIVPGISVANLVYGCTDIAACNYNSSANQNDNSCLYTGAICDDGNANTTNDVINGSCVCAGTAVGNGTYVPGNGVTDIDGNTYSSIIINGQEWMQQNLAVTKYRNGDPIPTGLSDLTWYYTSSGAYAIYNNDVFNNYMYGKLYNWYAVNDIRGICPAEWHVPTDAEWSAFINFLDPSADGGNIVNIAGSKMKSTTGWNSPNTGANNESGFTGLPAGYRNGNGGYNYIGEFGDWWSSTETDSNFAWYRNLGYDRPYVSRANYGKKDGFSVRCIKD